MHKPSLPPPLPPTHQHTQTPTPPKHTYIVYTQDVFGSPNHALATGSSTAGSSSHNGRKLQLPSTTSDDVFVSPQPAGTAEGEKDGGKEEEDFKDLDVVTSSGTLQHVRMSNLHQCSQSQRNQNFIA